MQALNPFVQFEVEGTSRTFILNEAAICRIGRDVDNTLVIPDLAASRHHALIRRDEAGECYISDLGSRNGTTVNNRPVTTPIPLCDGDRITIGQQDLWFRQPVAVTARPTTNHAQTVMSLESSLITVLVIDVRQYTMLSRELGEARLSELMSHVFRAAGEILYRRRCRSQKYIGDAVMSIWMHDGNAIQPGELSDILAAVEELRALFADMQARFHLPRPFTFGAGVNTGFASFGNMGGAAAADFTAMGDTVNKAFRLESATKGIGCNVAIGRASVDFLMPPLPIDRRPPSMEVPLKGYDAPECIYALEFEMVAAFRDHIMANCRP